MSFGGYIPLELLVDSESQARATHYIYLRKHQSRNSDDDSTVFVANLPRDVTLDNVKDICKALGDTILDEFDYQGQQRGLIHLVDEAAADRLLAKAAKYSKKKSAVEWGIYGPRGSEAYQARQLARFPDEQELEQQVDEYMQAFAEEEEQKRLEASGASSRVDEDGFTLVVGPKRKAMADIPAAGSDVRTTKRKRTKEKSDFYRFQIREKQKQEMNDLLKRYQDDKAKVEELKRQKKFRPY